MPLPAAAIPALISAGGQVLNSVGSVFQNHANRKWATKMYERQFNDNVRFWNMQNEYNSPENQMARFKAAGLNPNLIYGQGNSGNAGAIQTPDVQNVQFRNPEWGNALEVAGLTYMNAIADLDIKQAQVDNLKAQNSVIKQDALLKAAQTSGSMTSAERQRFDLELASELRETSADFRREQLRQLRTQIDLSINEDARRAAQLSSSLNEAVERMLNMREQRRMMPLERERMRRNIEMLRKDNTLRDLDIELRKQGISPNDPLWSRVLGRVLSNIFTEEGFNNSSGNIWKFLFR